MEQVEALAAINNVHIGSEYRVPGRIMKATEVLPLLEELAELCRPNVLRSDAEWEQVDARKKEICGTFGKVYPEDVFERFAPKG